MTDGSQQMTTPRKVKDYQKSSIFNADANANIVKVEQER